MAWVAMAAVVGIAIGVAFHRIILGMLIAGGLLFLGLVILISRADAPGPEH